MTRRRARVGLIATVVAVAGLLTSCRAAGTHAARRAGGKVSVVAAEDVWGTLARELGGDRVDVKSLIANPNTDPHDYEPTPADARAMASAQVVITNGIGYDAWADKLLSANPVSDRVVVRVGQLVGLKAGDNPHQWYAPEVVTKALDAMVGAYKRVDAAHADDYDRRRDDVESGPMARYRAAIAGIRSTYGGVAIGASESVITPMAEALGLHVLTPPSFLDAISEGGEPTSGDRALVDRLMVTKAIKVFVFNSQNATPDVQRLVDEAKANGIAVTTMTETVTPHGATFEEWQVRQLDELRAALAKAVGT